MVGQVGERHVVELKLGAGLEGLRLEANGQHLESALRALLDNAVQHSPPHEAVQVHLGLECDQVRLQVTDRGPGISEANQRRIFDRFFTTRGAQGGTGIGLAIVATVVRAHGGSVTVSSRPNEGATFCVRLPAPASLTGSESSSARWAGRR